MTAPPLVVALPGADGSVFHFRALLEKLKAIGLKAVSVDMDRYNGEMNLDAFAQWAAELTAKQLAPEQQCVMIAFSAGGGFAPIVIKKLEVLHPNPAAGIILLDPLYKVGGGLSSTHPDLATAMIATSVLDNLPVDTTDWARLRAGILQQFPSYARRFKGFETWHTVLKELAQDDGFASGTKMAEVSCPVRLLVCTNFKGMEMFEGAAGGDGCLPFWQGRLPQLTVDRVESSHVDIPFQAETSDKVVDFLREIIPSLEVTEAKLAAGKKNFDELKGFMDKARLDFRQTFQKGFPGDTFQL